MKLVMVTLIMFFTMGMSHVHDAHCDHSVAVAEPSVLALLAIGVLGLALFNRKKV